MPLVRASLLGKHGPSGTASRGRKVHRVPGRRSIDTSRKIPVRPPQRCQLAVRATSTVGLAFGPPGGRRATSTLDRATPTVCHMGHCPGQSSRRQYPERDAGQTHARHAAPPGPRRRPVTAPSPSGAPAPGRCTPGSRATRHIRTASDAMVSPAPSTSRQASPGVLGNRLVGNRVLGNRSAGRSGAGVLRLVFRTARSPGRPESGSNRRRRRN